MEAHSNSHNRQPETCAAIIARPTLADTIEALKEVGQMLFRHTLSCIVVVNEAELLLLSIALHMNPDVIASVGQTVLNQIAKDRVQERIIALHLQIRL